MARRSTMQRFAMFTASTAVAAGGVLLPTSAFAAPATPHMATVPTIAAVQDHQDQALADPAEKWMETTDAPSGITFRLPGKPTIEEISESTADGKIVNGRMYTAEAADGTVVGVIVYDAPGTPDFLDEGLQGTRQSFSDEYGKTATSTNGKETTVDGHPALESRFSAEDGNPALKGAACFIDGGDHTVAVATFAPAENEKALEKTHQQTLDSVRLSSPGTAA